VKGKGGGCLPVVVFLLVLAVAAGVYLERRWHDLPRESAGRTVLEVLDTPSAAEMKAHRRRIVSGEVLQGALRRMVGKDSGGPEQIQQLRERTEVTVEGPFLTVTVRGRKRGLDKVAEAIASAYEEDLVQQTITARRLRSEAVQAHMTLGESDVEKARLTMLDLAKKLGLSTMGVPSSQNEEVRQLAGRAAKAQTDLVLLEERRKLLTTEDLKAAAQAALTLPDKRIPHSLLSDWQEAEAAAAAVPTDNALKAGAERRKSELADKLKEIREVMSSQEAALRLEQQVLHRQLDMLRAQVLTTAHQDHELNTARENFERAAAQLRRLKEEATANRVEHSVVLRPVRIVDAAQEVRVPARRTLRGLKTATAGCAALLAGCLLMALTKALCRRA
jgi:hypothetical protein